MATPRVPAGRTCSRLKAPSVTAAFRPPCETAQLARLRLGKTTNGLRRGGRAARPGRTNALDGTFNSSEDCEWSPLALGDAAEVLASIGRLAATQLVPSDRKTMHYLRVDGERLQPSRGGLIAGYTFAILGDTQVDALALLTFVANR